MISLIAAVAVAAAAGTPPPNAAPLREVVYKVSYTHHRSLNSETFGGAPTSQRADITDDGTVTVDVMAIANDAIGIKLTESWRQHPRSQVFLGAVTPSGSISFGTQPISEVSASLLPFFGPKFSNGQTLNVGVRWVSNSDSPAASVSTTYEVKSIDDNGVTIAESETVKVKGTAGMDSSISGNVVYLAPKLVPISGSLTRHSSRSGASESDVEDVFLNFDRTSDTLDKTN